MNCSYKITFLALTLVIFLGLTTYVPASAQWRTQNLPTSTQDTDLSVSPSKGPADAPVEIAVFSCFK
jgi:hypothetical protein